MKKTARKASAKRKAAPRKAAPRKAAARKATAKKPAPTYAPKPIESSGWAPFRYPPQ